MSQVKSWHVLACLEVAGANLGCRSAIFRHMHGVNKRIGVKVPLLIKVNNITCCRTQLGCFFSSIDSTIMSGGYGSIPTTAHEPDPPSLKRKLIAEVFGTCVLVQVGCGGLCAGLYMDAYVSV